MKCSKKLLSAITNVDIRGDAWIQATLPVRHGGLSLRRLSALALPCYLSSLISCSELIRKINPSLHVEHTTSLLGSAVVDFRILTGLEEIPLGDMAGSQRAWDDKVCQSEYNGHLAEADQVERARLLAARELGCVVGRNPQPQPRPASGRRSRKDCCGTSSGYSAVRFPSLPLWHLGREPGSPWVVVPTQCWTPSSSRKS